jgi:uncharacterized membrane protein
MGRSATDQRSLAPAGIVLGIGLGGFVDGILFHQVLQLHNMLSGKVPPDTMENMRVNMTADGLFHAAVWIVTVVGVALLWRALKGPRQITPSSLRLIGYMLAGWGWFNLVEGLIDHQILGLHHVVEALGLSIYDWLFLAFGIVLIVVGHLLGREQAQKV